MTSIRFDWILKDNGIWQRYRFNRLDILIDVGENPFVFDYSVNSNSVTTDTVVPYSQLERLGASFLLNHSFDLVENGRFVNAVPIGLKDDDLRLPKLAD